jgi:ADP-ribose pyrophosphatase YjhB (NUDIX family)
MPPEMIRDGEELPFRDARGQDWLASWHPAGAPPPGKRHGADGICFTPDGLVVLVTADGERWIAPGGRPEGDEDWRQTLDREVLEEACAQVERATLLGFARGVCLRGEEQGLVLVRSWWRADVSLQEWHPQYESKERRLLPLDDAQALVLSSNPHGLPAQDRRIFLEAIKAKA